MIYCNNTIQIQMDKQSSTPAPQISAKDSPLDTTLKGITTGQLKDYVIYDVSIANPKEPFDIEICQVGVSYLHSIGHKKGMVEQPALFTKIWPLPQLLSMIIKGRCHVLLALVCLRLREAYKELSKEFSFQNLRTFLNVKKPRESITTRGGKMQMHLPKLAKIVEQAETDLSHRHSSNVLECTTWSLFHTFYQEYSLRQLKECVQTMQYIQREVLGQLCYIKETEPAFGAKDIFFDAEDVVENPTRALIKRGLFQEGYSILYKLKA
ncbi:hypothetical protein FGO68_gene12567 [Halteria grandinella]|uniref:Uncharacterized protein n=1 Tax=Halteria grandinella TaxID=5974 RepID=A0A8J8SZ46_HALGN|nr:hypothetical protein FGO68_gene12567 [Halteria grandinella]